MTPDDIFAVTAEEGGDWIPLEDYLAGHNYTRFHSMLLKDGQTWDEINGFRGPLFDYTPKSMKIVSEHMSVRHEL